MASAERPVHRGAGDRGRQRRSLGATATRNPLAPARSPTLHHSPAPALTRRPTATRATAARRPTATRATAARRPTATGTAPARAVPAGPTAGASDDRPRP